MARLRTVLKLLGVATLAGVAAGGVLVARDERRREAYTPDEVRARLHARLAEAQARGQASAAGPGGAADAAAGPDPAGPDPAA